MSTITELKDKINTKTWNLVLLSIATAGIYPLMWLYTNYSTLNTITKKKIVDNTFIIWMAICAGLSTMLSGSDEEILDVISIILVVALFVLWIVWAFKAKSALQEYVLTEHKIDLRMNGFYTFLFTFYYINYCINDLPEVQRKHNIISNSTVKNDS